MVPAAEAGARVTLSSGVSRPEHVFSVPSLLLLQNSSETFPEFRPEPTAPSAVMLPVLRLSHVCSSAETETSLPFISLSLCFVYLQVIWDR